VYYGATEQVIGIKDEDAWILLLHLVSGEWLTGNPALGYVWEQLEHGHELSAAIDAAAEGWVPAETLRSALESQIPALVRHAMLVGKPAPPDRFARAILARGQPATRRVAPTASDGAASTREVVAAAVGFWIAILIQRLPFLVRLRFLRAVTRIRAQRPTLPSTLTLVGLNSARGGSHNGWAECLEISMGSFIAAALLGRAPSWCIGAAFAPLRPHAWLEVDGCAVDHAEQFGTPQAMIRITDTRDAELTASQAGTASRGAATAPQLLSPSLGKLVLGHL
jgi:hypothetical protein